MPQRVDFGRPIIDRRLVERRQVHTMLDPSMERRKVRRRQPKRPKTMKITETKLASAPASKSDRISMIIAIGLFLIAIECWAVGFIRV